MRPCLEDFLQFLINEFRIDTLPDAFGVLADGRERWRRRQIAALVRDAPDEAVRLLTEIGYDVTPPESGERKPNTTALQRW